MRRKKTSFLIISLGICMALPCSKIHSKTLNIAPQAKATATSFTSDGHPENINDGIVRIKDKGEWVSDVKETFWGEIDFPSIRLEWENPVEIEKINIYDRMNPDSHSAQVTLHFSDGSKIDVCGIPEDGSPKEILLYGKNTEFINFEITDGYGDNVGLSEIEVFPTPTFADDYVSYVEPTIETGRGRFFFFITGCQPQGLIGAAPMTRNKNQGGGGYNYNDSHILGFPQIHAWMLSGIEFMPADDTADPTKGENGWRSKYSHAGEIARPAYHRVYLEDYDVWVEQTATQRTSMYRLTYSENTEANLIFNLGGFLGNCTMVNAYVKKISNKEIEGSFSTVGRLWGGPDDVKVYFVAEFDKPIERIDAWDDSETFVDIISFKSKGSAVARNDGMSYSDAPSAGVNIIIPAKGGEPLLVKMAISYVSIDNARTNLYAENPGWNFNETVKNSTDEWNEWFSRIDVKGGTEQQRIKFYTDLWHTLLGRHKINDFNGQYPDRTTGGTIEWKNVKNPDVIVRKVPLNPDGSLKYNMYNTDALWLTQWNQNALWGMAWPALFDEFCASMLQYGENGGLIPRGPCGGGYSFIMSGCPATSMITSAFQRGLLHKWDAKKAYNLLKKNHEEGGMLGYNSENEFSFYEVNGYAPERGGLTVQWCFEDWALSQMAKKLGKKKDAEKFEKRSQGWKTCIEPETGLLLPKKSDGTWLHTDPLSGWGFEEANSWQTTFGISNDLPGLAEAMGGQETLCDKLNFAMEQSVDGDFVAGYGTGYVSYANQPGLSTAHVFSHAGKPWLTQYWVRQVKEKAYGSISPARGYGGHDEDQGQMSAVSALMAIGLFGIDGGSAFNPSYDITSPIFDEIVIALDPEYYMGKQFKIKTYNNSAENCYIQRASLNGVPHNSFKLSAEDFANGGLLEIWLGDTPNEQWGVD